MPGGKGVNVARTLKTLGQPVIATGLRGRRDGHADRRAAHGGVDPQRLRAHPRGVAHEHRGATTRPTASRPRSTSAARRSSPSGGRALPRQAALPRARRGHRRVRRLAAARRRARRLRGAHPRAAQARASRRSSTPTASRCASPSAPSPTSSRRTSSRPRSSSATSSTTRRTASIAVARDGRSSGAARGDHDAARRLRRLDPRGARQRPGRPAPRVDRAARGRRAGRRGDAFLAGSWPPATAASRPAECLRFGVACGAESTQRLGAGPHRPARGRAAAGRDRVVQRLELPAEVPLGRPAAGRAAVATGRCRHARVRGADPLRGPPPVRPRP